MSGSAPRAWGTLPVALRQDPDARFSPTCVGNTSWEDQGILRRPVQPHVRGEHDGDIAQDAGRDGSAPRAWGPRGHRARRQRRHRFSPTCVGNTHVSRAPMNSRSVQPHVRGEHADAPPQMRSPCGSAPRAWGTRELTREPCPCSRFSPTCVGNTRPRPMVVRTPPVQPHVRGEHPCCKSFMPRGFLEVKSATDWIQKFPGRDDARRPPRGGAARAAGPGGAAGRTGGSDGGTLPGCGVPCDPMPRSWRRPPCGRRPAVPDRGSPAGAP